MKVSFHSATQCMVVVIETLCGLLRVPRIMAMSVESEFVAQFLAASLTFGRDVIYFYEVFWSKEEFTPPAFPLLLLKKLCERPFQHRVIFESLAPIEQITIVGAGFSFYLGVSLDARFIVLPDFLFLWGRKHPVSRFILLPIFPMDPLFPSGRMLVSCPLLKLMIEDEIADGEGLGCYH